jgi:hypothetical protein
MAVKLSPEMRHLIEAVAAVEHAIAYDDHPELYAIAADSVSDAKQVDKVQADIYCIAADFFALIHNCADKEEVNAIRAKVVADNTRNTITEKEIIEEIGIDVYEKALYNYKTM